MKYTFSNIVKAAAAMAVALVLPSTITADPIPEPLLNTPVQQGEQMFQETVRTFIEEAYENARANSPFASFNAADETTVSASPTAGRILDYASRFVGTRYRLGASGPKAFDCSGFTSYVFRNGGGVELQRSSRQQFTQGTRVNVSSLRPGDLLFFSSSSSGRGNVGHVAIVESVDPENNSCRFIHASTKHGVTYQNFPDGGYYSRHFIGAKRVLDAE